MKAILILLLVSCNTSTEPKMSNYELIMSEYEVLTPLVIADKDTIEIIQTEKYNLHYIGTFKRSLTIEFKGFGISEMAVKIKGETAYIRKDKFHKFVYR